MPDLLADYVAAYERMLLALMFVYAITQRHFADYAFDYATLMIYADDAISIIACFFFFLLIAITLRRFFLSLRVAVISPFDADYDITLLSLFCYADVSRFRHRVICRRHMLIAFRFDAR